MIRLLIILKQGLFSPECHIIHRFTLPWPSATASAFHSCSCAFPPPSETAQCCSLCGHAQDRGASRQRALPPPPVPPRGRLLVPLGTGELAVCWARSLLLLFGTHGNCLWRNVFGALFFCFDSGTSTFVCDTHLCPPVLS